MGTVSSVAAPELAIGRPVRLSRIGDELLARQAARGSDRAFTALYERYYPQLHRYCRSIVRDEADAQDALQSTFAGALVALRRDQRTAPLRPWLYRIAHNESISLLRRRDRGIEQKLAAIPGPQAVSSAEEQATERARWAAIVADLAVLPDRQRGALLLRELGGLSHEEIAITLGVSVGAAKQAIFEARQGLAEFEEGRAMSCEEIRRQISAGDGRVLRGRRVRAHLGECAGCEAFAAAIPARRAELRAFAPALPPAAATAILSSALHGAPAHAGAGVGASTAAASAGTVGKAAGTAIAWKALAGAAIVATAAAGATGLQHVLRHHAGGSAAPAAATIRPGTSPRSPGAIGTRPLSGPHHAAVTALAGFGRASSATARHGVGNAATPSRASNNEASQASGRGHGSRAAGSTGAAKRTHSHSNSSAANSSAASHSSAANHSSASAHPPSKSQRTTIKGVRPAGKSPHSRANYSLTLTPLPRSGGVTKTPIPNKEGR